MIRDFAQWTATLLETGALEELRDCRVGIEAADYLSQRILKNELAKESLVPALGGLPLALQRHIEADLAIFRHFAIEPYFVFSGLDITEQVDPFVQKKQEATVNADAWNLYDSQQAIESVAKFGESLYVTPEDLFRALQSILTDQHVRWTVAPYSAWAQLAYLEKAEYVHAISGSSDILLFGCQRLITLWDLERKQFRFIRRDKCIEDLSKPYGNSRITEKIFLDTCLLAGTPFAPTLPVLDQPSKAGLLKPPNAVKMIIGNKEQTGYAVVVTNNDVSPSGMEYVNRFQKAYCKVKNHPVYTVEGKVEPQNLDQMPNNAGEYLGKRLPDEILHYMSMGLINPRILQWRTTQNVYEVPPPDGGESPEYKNLVSSKLVPLRTTVINLISSSLNNWYRANNLSQTNWFSPEKSITIHVEKPSESQTPSIVDNWNVKEATFKDVIAQHKGCGLLGSAILSLQNTDFVPKTVAKKDPKNVLSSTSEILYNSIWRFLALREYVDSNHNLTHWGKVLAAVVTGLKGKAEHEEAAVLAVELIRMNLLTSDINMFPTYHGAPMRGSTQDKNSSMLVSRVAGLCSLQHGHIGFTGPLSQHLLGYNSIVNAVRQSLRDLVEVAATHMFLTGSCNRHAEIQLIAMKLPFLLANNCALSIAVKSYFDELVSNDANPTSPETKARVLTTASERYFPQALDIAGDLKRAFELWDAIYGAIPDSARWKDTNDWLAARR